MKVCSHCRQAKSEDEYYICKKKLKSGTIKETLRYVCKACDRKAKRERDKRNPEVRANKHLINKYGITLEDKRKMIQLQGCKCAICPVKLSDIDLSKSHVDHCHETGEIRGVLCTNCNRGIGHLQHNTSIMLKAIQYLERSRPLGWTQLQPDQEGNCEHSAHASPPSQDQLG